MNVYSNLDDEKEKHFNRIHNNWSTRICLVTESKKEVPGFSGKNIQLSA
jgi:hypothetical protein